MSQLKRVKKKLERDGYITRNECLSQFPAITRLSAIILTLKKEGYEFETKDTGRDYVYKLVKETDYVREQVELDLFNFKQQQYV